MKLKKTILVSLLALSLVLGTVACSSTPSVQSSQAASASSTTVASSAPSNSSAASTSAAASGKKRTFGVAFPIVHPFFQPVGVDAENYGKQAGVDVITKAPDSANADLQIQIMENYIAMKVDGIAIGPTDPVALVPTINKAIDAGIKLICFETDAPKAEAHSYIGTDNYKAGRQMGYVIGKNLNGKGNIMILTGLQTQMSLNERIRGIKECLASNYPDVKIIDTESSEGDAQKAVTQTENMIQAHPDFNAIVGIDATAGPAAVSVWKAKGWQNNDQHMILTFDDMPDNVAGLKDGYIKALVAQRQASWGKSIVQMLNDLCDGKTVAATTDTGSIEITTKNVDTYKDEPSWVEGK